MRYLTERKRAVGKGAAGTGTEHHWHMQVSAVGLALIIPMFIFYVGRSLGAGHEAVLATFARPVPAILTALVLVVGLKHFRMGAQIMIEDYFHGSTKKTALIITTVISYGLTATGLFALAKIAL